MTSRRAFVGQLAALPALVALPEWREVPDLVLVNGDILTQDATTPHAEAIAIAGAHVFAVGSNAEMRALARRGTRVVDLGQRVAKGQPVADLIAMDGPEAFIARTPIVAGTDGLVLTRALRKYATRGEGIMKIVGTAPLPQRKGGYLLED